MDKIRRATVVDKHVGRRVRERRLLLGLTQHQLAAGLGITYQQEYKYENGINRVSASRLLQLAEALGVGVTYFFEGASSGQPPLRPRAQQTLDLMERYALIRDPKRRAVVRACVESVFEKEQECGI